MIFTAHFTWYFSRYFLHLIFYHFSHHDRIPKNSDWLSCRQVVHPSRTSIKHCPRIYIFFSSLGKLNLGSRPGPLGRWASESKAVSFSAVCSIVLATSSWIPWGPHPYSANLMKPREPPCSGPHPVSWARNSHQPCPFSLRMEASVFHFKLPIMATKS